MYLHNTIHYNLQSQYNVLFFALLYYQKRNVDILIIRNLGLLGISQKPYSNISDKVYKLGDNITSFDVSSLGISASKLTSNNFVIVPKAQNQSGTVMSWTNAGDMSNANTEYKEAIYSYNNGKLSIISAPKVVGTSCGSGIISLTLNYSVYLFI